MWSVHNLFSELVSEDPFIVRLLFEPSGRPDSQKDYYLTAKENLCVVCGKAESYIRFVFCFLRFLFLFWKLDFCFSTSVFTLGRTLSHTSTGATSQLRWRTTTRTTSCCCARPVTRLQTSMTGSWSSSWQRNTRPHRAVRRAFGCSRTQTGDGCARPHGLSSAPATGCPNPERRSSCQSSRASSATDIRRSRKRCFRKLQHWKPG